jgi:acetyl esterase/lipase
VTGGLAGQLEAIPVAGAGRFTVITIDYRSSPEYRFPAATEDVAAVYRSLLKRHKPENIGIYGCSTGATLSAGSVAWLQKKQLPRPGAIGLFGDGATKDDHVDGDAWFINVPLSGGAVLSPEQSHQVLHAEPYMQGTDYNDPLVAPVVSQAVLSKFPPTLVISGTRDVGMSEAVYTHTQLVKAGVEADLHIWEGMWHCFS